MSASLEAHVGIAFERGVVLAPRTLVVILRLRLISYIYVLVTLMIYFLVLLPPPTLVSENYGVIFRKMHDQITAK